MSVHLQIGANGEGGDDSEDDGEEDFAGGTDSEEDLGGGTASEHDSDHDTEYEDARFRFRRSTNAPGKKIDASQVMRCECKARLGNNPWCWDRCSNEGARVFCDDSVCLGKKECSNLPFEQREYLDVRVSETDSRGKGLITKEASTKGTFVAEYVGHILNTKGLVKALQRDTKEPNFYIMEVKNDVYIDARFHGNLSRYINSSCNPNCECITFRDSRNEETRVGIFTIKDLSAGAELTFDYNFKEFGQLKTFHCLCGECNFKLRARARERPAGRTAAEAEVEASDAAEEKKKKGVEQSTQRAERARQRNFDRREVREVREEVIELLESESESDDET
jgi:hypothetical protein